MRWSHALVTPVLAACILGNSPAGAEPPDSFEAIPDSAGFAAVAAVHRDWLLITDCTTSYAVVANPGVERFMFTDGLGIMRSMGGGDALGASLDLHITGPGARTGPTLRYRHSFALQRSLELSLGYVPGSRPGITGFVVDARYRPTRDLYVQIGAFRNREISETHSYSQASGYVQTVREHLPVRITAGFGFDGTSGRVLWAVQALVIGILYGGYFIAGGAVE